ncbi:hypothetical protein QOZ80_2AG0111210 [Eleusine coracana subsp. coracana]|nr:hypothetical protein QOZ80_2AG0111210 [Eleusine coracana subsp. coracana]
MAAWAGLHFNLVARILEHLPCRAHRAAFSAVCSNWRAVGSQLPPPRQLPWLLLPSAAAQAPVVFCIRCRAAHGVFLHEDVFIARCFGSHPGGWLVLALQPQQGGGFELHNIQLQASGYALHNLHTGERLAVPGFFVTPDNTGDVGMVVLGAALSAAPTADGAFLAVVLDPGDGASIADVIYYSGHGLKGFHVLTDAEEVLVYVPEFALDGKLTTRLVTYRFPDHQVSAEPGCTASRYLIDFFDELVMVVRFVSTVEDEGTRWIHAFQLSWTVQAVNQGDRQAEWENVSFPDNVVVMLGRCSSMAFVSPAVALDGLYFLDDANSFDDVMARLQEWHPFPCMDMGRRTVQHEQEQVEEVFPIRPPSEFSPAVWLFHSNPADA